MATFYYRGVEPYDVVVVLTDGQFHNAEGFFGLTEWQRGVPIFERPLDIRAEVIIELPDDMDLSRWSRSSWDLDYGMWVVPAGLLNRWATVLNW